MHRQGELPELLIPASGPETFRVAVHYGADAIYIGGEAFSLRAKAINFSREQMREAVAYGHEHGVKVYVTVNILAHNDDLGEADEYLAFLKELKPDALLVADPGIFMRAKKICPQIPLHISTQANNVNYETFLFWHQLGAERVVCGRELSLKEIAQIRAHIPDSLEIEAFIHGAMCISYSGRCLLSNFFTGRDANQGACTHPCRWQYHVGRMQNDDPQDESDTGSQNRDLQTKGLQEIPAAELQNRDLQTKGLQDVPAAELQNAGNCSDPALTETRLGLEPAVWIEEETRPGEKVSVYENERGTFLFNSKDLCMIEHIPDMIDAGIDSLKIEGRMKNALYVATAARTYRRALDDLAAGRDVYESHMDWYREQIHDCTFRPFTTGFFYGKPGADAQIYDSNTYEKTYTYLGWVQGIKHIDGNQYIEITQKNKFSVGEEIEVMCTNGEDRKAVVQEILDEEGHPMQSAPHPQQKLFVGIGTTADRYDIVRRRDQ